MGRAERGRALTIFAVLFAVLAISNLLKPFQLGGARTGFVFFGQRLSGAANAVVAPLFAAYLAVYAFGIWRMKRFALAMAHAYATYVVLNLILFSLRTPEPQVGQLFMLVYAAVAIGVSVGSAVLLTKRKDELS
jgi:hypothetical protein